MFYQWIRSLALASLVLVVATGCSSGTRTQPVEPSVGPTETPDRTPPPVDTTSVSSSSVDSNGNPFFPGTSRLLPRTFYYGYDRANLGPDDLAALEMHASFLRDNPGRRVIIEGHCDERGTREYNLALGERRANSVRRFLVSAGVPGSQLETVSFGEERPEDAGHAESAWGRNRRAVMLYR